VFAIGAYLVWWRRARLRFALGHFVPLLALPLGYYLVIWTTRVAPAEMMSIVNTETVGRIATFQWEHVTSTPGFLVRAVAVQLPFVLWCFWEWRGARDARMDAGDLTLRMCSGAAVMAVVVFVFFPGRPTRYLLPNVLLFMFAVAPAVAHFAGQQRELGAFSRRGLRVVGVLGAAALIVLPFVGERVGLAAVGAALVAALGSLVVHTPRQLVAFCLLLPLVADWTIGLERALGWCDGARARGPAGAVLRRELDGLGATTTLVTRGHIDAPFVLGAGLLPDGDEQLHTTPVAPWLLHENADAPPSMPKEYVERLRVCVPGETFVLRERNGAHK
jgi:hypothetical protein